MCSGGIVCAEVFSPVIESCFLVAPFFHQIFGFFCVLSVPADGVFSIRAARLALLDFYHLPSPGKRAGR